MRLITGSFPGLILGLAVALTSAFAFSQPADPLLNGIAIHSEFGRQQFIAALYCSAPSDNSAALSGNPALRMELKILAPEGLTLRRFSRMWLEAMAINNSAVQLSAQADNMLLFDKLFKDRLLQNDTLVIDYRHRQGVNISLNKVRLGTIADDDFFAMLVRTWIGDVPLSSEFKNAVLKAGRVTVDLKSRFDSIQPSPQRSLEIEKWLDSKPARSQVDNHKASRVATAKIAAAPQQLATELKPVEKTTTAEATKPLAHERASTAITYAASAVISHAAGPAIAAPWAVEQIEAKPAVESQALLARQLYISRLLKKIRANTRYPARANQLGQSDSLRIAVVIDRQGNIISRSFVQGSQYTQLNEAVLDGIKKSAPLPQMPDALTESSFEFTVPISFVSGKPQSALSARASP